LKKVLGWVKIDSGGVYPSQMLGAMERPPPAFGVPLHGRGMVVAGCGAEKISRSLERVNSPPVEGWQAKPDGVVSMATRHVLLRYFQREIP
jgi:hypothetical protein